MEIHMSFLDSRKVGALIRSFAIKPDQVKENVSQTMASIDRMHSVQIGGKPYISRYEVLVPKDENYTERDCGQMAELLRTEVTKAGYKNVHVSEVQHGDLFVGVLNYGIAKLLRAGHDYGIILSKEAEAYFTQDAVEDLIVAAEKGARYAGIALSELTESIMQGRIANTFAKLHLLSAVQCGCYDLRNAQPKKDARIISRAQAWDGIKNFWDYDLKGVEEIILLIRLVRTFGPCIAPILPRGDDVKVWKMPDPQHDPAGYARSVNKLGTKFVRQSHFADLEHADLSYLMGGVMEGYRHPNYIK